MKQLANFVPSHSPRFNTYKILLVRTSERNPDCTRGDFGGRSTIIVISEYVYGSSTNLWKKCVVRFVHDQRISHTMEEILVELVFVDIEAMRDPYYGPHLFERDFGGVDRCLQNMKKNYG